MFFLIIKHRKTLSCRLIFNQLLTRRLSCIVCALLKFLKYTQWLWCHGIYPYQCSSHEREEAKYSGGWNNSNKDFENPYQIEFFLFTLLHDRIPPTRVYQRKIPFISLFNTSWFDFILAWKIKISLQLFWLEIFLNKI